MVPSSFARSDRDKAAMKELARRSFLRGSAGVALVTLFGCREGKAAVKFSSQIMAFLAAVCDTIIPDTDTDGATKTGVPDFVTLMFGREIAAEYGAATADTGVANSASREEVVKKLRSLEATLDRAGKRMFTQAGAEQRLETLSFLDRAAFPASELKTAGAYTLADINTYRTIKRLTVVGYYTSEVGASEELQYVLVPGRYEPDIPYESEPAFSNEGGPRDY